MQILLFGIFCQILLVLLVSFFSVFTGYELLYSYIKYRRSLTINNKNLNSSDNFKKDNQLNLTNCDTEKKHLISKIHHLPKKTCSILLPVCNEISVVEQLITSIYEIEVPKNCNVEILLLDDSSEDNSKIIKSIFDRFIATNVADVVDDLSLVSSVQSVLPIKSLQLGSLDSNLVLSDNVKNTSTTTSTPISKSDYKDSKSISYYHRSDSERVGFKAGNISYGLKYAKGDFIVIFDADNIPPKDFLLKTMPYFLDEKVGFLQTAIEFRNKKQNFITRFLALETSHKDDITGNQSNSNKTQDINAYANESFNRSSVLSTCMFSNNDSNKANKDLNHSLHQDSNLDSNVYSSKSTTLAATSAVSVSSPSSDNQDFASLTGSSCIWRKLCLDDIGGFSSATLTEDIDLCYRAQLKGWKYVYAENVVSSEELPTSISGLRVQRHRWAYGLIRNAFLYTSKVLIAKDFSFSKKFKAFMLISQTFLLASFVVLLLLSLPLVFVTNELGLIFNSSCTIFLLTTIIWGYNNLASGKNRIDTVDTSNLASTDVVVATANIESIKVHTSASNTTECAKNENGMSILFIEYIGYILMYLPLSLYYFIALMENIFGIKTSFIPTEKKGMNTRSKEVLRSSMDECFDAKSTGVKTSVSQDLVSQDIQQQEQQGSSESLASKSLVKKSKINNVLFALEIFCFGYASSVCVLSVYFENWWTLLYGSICFIGFGLVLYFSAIEMYKK